MSHELESIAYNEAGGTPWHKLGVPVQGRMTWEEAVTKAGLDWEVEDRDIAFLNNGVQIPNLKAITRVKDDRVYKVFSDGYKIVQNRDAFKMIDDVVNGGGACFETAGALFNGAKIWALLKLDGVVNIAGEQIDKYLTLVNSHDGSSALQIFWTPIRVVCNNTLTMAMDSTLTRFYARHTQGVTQKVLEAQKVLGLANIFYERWEQQANHLTQYMLPEGNKPTFFREVFGYPQNTEDEDIRGNILQAFERVEELVWTGDVGDNADLHGTAWAYYNAVAKYADFEKTYRGQREDPTKQLQGAMFGTGADMKERAFAYLSKITVN